MKNLGKSSKFKIDLNSHRKFQFVKIIDTNFHSDLRVIILVWKEQDSWIKDEWKIVRYFVCQLATISETVHSGEAVQHSTIIYSQNQNFIFIFVRHSFQFLFNHNVYSKEIEKLRQNKLRKSFKEINKIYTDVKNFLLNFQSRLSKK